MSEDGEFEAAVLAGAVSALRRRCGALEARARIGTSRHQRFPSVVVRTSQAAYAADMARRLGAIADDMEAGR